MIVDVKVLQQKVQILEELVNILTVSNAVLENIKPTCE